MKYNRRSYRIVGLNSFKNDICALSQYFQVKTIPNEKKKIYIIKEKIYFSEDGIFENKTSKIICSLKEINELKIQPLSKHFVTLSTHTSFDEPNAKGLMIKSKSYGYIPLAFSDQISALQAASLICRYFSMALKPVKWDIKFNSWVIKKYIFFIIKLL